MSAPTITWRCYSCGSPLVEVMARCVWDSQQQTWVFEDLPEYSPTWCPDCETQDVRLDDVSDSDVSEGGAL